MLRDAEIAVPRPECGAANLKNRAETEPNAVNENLI